MGRVKSQMIKKAARQLHEQIGDFTMDFNDNKKLLKGTIPYKSVRNRVAGGIVRLVKRQKMKHLKEHKKTTVDDGRTEEDN